uniref:Uncharacterized protein n=1 Tax=Molossus molossus TaxID=27622 RepID=A0A7J8GKH5_MOLMO|nr:hypothetical protein HJG59_011485 [Molossus molossus]
MAAGKFQWPRWASSSQKWLQGVHSGWARAWRPGDPCLSPLLTHVHSHTCHTHSYACIHPQDTRSIHSDTQTLRISHTQTYATQSHTSSLSHLIHTHTLLWGPKVTGWLVPEHLILLGGEIKRLERILC